MRNLDYWGEKEVHTVPRKHWVREGTDTYNHSHLDRQKTRLEKMPGRGTLINLEEVKYIGRETSKHGMGKKTYLERDILINIYN